MSSTPLPWLMLTELLGCWTSGASILPSVCQLPGWYSGWSSSASAPAADPNCQGLGSPAPSTPLQAAFCALHGHLSSLS